MKKIILYVLLINFICLGCSEVADSAKTKVKNSIFRSYKKVEVRYSTGTSEWTFTTRNLIIKELTDGWCTMESFDKGYKNIRTIKIDNILTIKEEIYGSEILPPKW